MKKFHGFCPLFVVIYPEKLLMTKAVGIYFHLPEPVSGILYKKQISNLYCMTKWEFIVTKH